DRGSGRSIRCCRVRASLRTYAFHAAEEYWGAVTGNHYFSDRPASRFAPKRIRVRLGEHEVEVVTAPGVFSPDHLDTGTAVLLDTVPEPPATGQLLDIGSGWGPIALDLARRSPAATVWAVDVNERALDLVRANAAQLHMP